MIAIDPLPPSRCSVQIPEDAIATPASTEEAASIHLVPQRRAVLALSRGLAELAPGFNVAVIGHRGCGRTSTAMTLARQEAARRPSPRDLVLLPNQRWPLEPRPVLLPTASGPGFVRALEELHSALNAATHEILEGRARNRLQVEILREQSVSERAFHEQLMEVAKEHGLALIASDEGFDFVPIDDDDDDTSDDDTSDDKSEGESEGEEKNPPADPSGEGEPSVVSETISAPSSSTKSKENNKENNKENTKENGSDGGTNRYVAALDALRPHVEETQRQLALLEVESAAKLLQRQREALCEAFKECFAALTPSALPTAEVAEFVDELHAYLVRVFQLDSSLTTPPPQGEIPRGLVIPTLLTTSDEGSPAPLIQAQNVSLASLFGRSVATTPESRYPEPGTFIAGDIHRANGGFLVIDVEALVKRERVYEHLKSCLLARAIQPHEEADEGPALRIQPVELDLKVLLIADPDLISQLQDLDPEFNRLFKIRAGFTEDMPRDQALQVYPNVARWLHLHRRLPTCDRSALRELLIYGARLAEDQERMTTNIGLLSDLLAEAAAAAEPGRELSGADLREAQATMCERHGQMRDKLRELYSDGALRVELRGAHIGQVNGLAVVSDGFQSVGRPCRVTAVTYAGTQGTLNIDREVEMSGPIHSKGMMILSGYLYDRFARSHPVAFGASVVFEQTYMPIEGDSASTAELFAILSSLSQVPARQDIGITGSVDQRGRILPVGAINEKIEGFFDLCLAEGLSGTQGVMIPHTNIRNLILRPDVIDAIAAGTFSIWPITTVEEGVELLMGIPAGADIIAHDEVDRPHPDLRFPDATVYGRIERRLARLRRAQRELLRASTP